MMTDKKILIAQASPASLTPYSAIKEKYGVEIDFIKLSRIVPLSSIQMRAQHCNPLDYSAVVFSSKSTIDAFFSICGELRVKVPESMKYFCTNEKVAMYLQKHIVYRKRKIFYGAGTPSSVLDLITARHKDENFLIVTSDSPSNSMTRAFDSSEYKHGSIIFARTVSCDIKDIDLNDYGLLVLYNKYDVASIYENFPDFKKGNTKIVAYGSDSLKTAAAEKGLEVDITGPSAECPTVTSAIEMLLNKK